MNKPCILISYACLIENVSVQTSTKNCSPKFMLITGKPLRSTLHFCWIYIFIYFYIFFFISWIRSVITAPSTMYSNICFILKFCRATSHIYDLFLVIITLYLLYLSTYKTYTTTISLSPSPLCWFNKSLTKYCW